MENKTTLRAFHMLEDDFKQLQENSNNLHRVIEDVDNDLWKNNLRLKALKEGVKGGNLKAYLDNLFTGCFRLESDTEFCLSKEIMAGKE